MPDADKYVKIVEWSDTDECFIGSCPELFFGGCHGNDSRAVFAELCDVIDETVAIYKEDGRELAPPMSGKEFVNQMQRVS